MMASQMLTPAPYRDRVGTDTEARRLGHSWLGGKNGAPLAWDGGFQRCHSPAEATTVQFWVRSHVLNPNWSIVIAVPALCRGRRDSSDGDLHADGSRCRTIPHIASA